MLKLIDALASTCIIAVGLITAAVIIKAAPSSPEPALAFELVRKADASGLLRHITLDSANSALLEIYALKEPGTLVYFELLCGSHALAEFGDPIKHPRSHYEVPLVVNGTLVVLSVDIA